jgi:hypothetical protein
MCKKLLTMVAASRIDKRLFLAYDNGGRDDGFPFLADFLTMLCQAFHGTIISRTFCDGVSLQEAEFRNVGTAAAMKDLLDGYKFFGGCVFELPKEEVDEPWVRLRDKTFPELELWKQETHEHRAS